MKTARSVKRISRLLLLCFAITLSAMFFISCKKCRTCQASTMIDSRLVDFEKECGTESEKDAMEENFIKEYPDSLGFYTYCYD
ncbi:MAG: hypothetical protein KJ607_08875 [Bacteroidetes bacterium]|nr:hypothetical protein [Bacteroidota bacterium]